MKTKTENEIWNEAIVAAMEFVAPEIGPKVWRLRKPVPDPPDPSEDLTPGELDNPPFGTPGHYVNYDWLHRIIAEVKRRRELDLEIQYEINKAKDYLRSL